MSEINKAIDKLIVAIGDDYKAFNLRSEYGYDADRVNKFRNELSVKTGRKYAKILTDRSVWGFVQIEDDAKFKSGDILMAAGYNQPARNKPRTHRPYQPASHYQGPRYLF